MPIPKDISRNMLIRLIFEYNKYIQTANHEDLYLNGWRPVSVSEFYDSKFQHLLYSQEDIQYS